VKEEACSVGRDAREADSAVRAARLAAAAATTTVAMAAASASMTTVRAVARAAIAEATAQPAVVTRVAVVAMKHHSGERSRCTQCTLERQAALEADTAQATW
jgi:hypothetical protein